MRKLFGPCVSCIKGKTVSPTDGKVINKWLASAPGERLCVDINFMTVMSKKGKFVVMPMLIVEDDYTGYIDVIHLPSKTTDSVIAFYNHYDFVVKEIRSDRENNVCIARSPGFNLKKQSQKYRHRLRCKKCADYLTSIPTQLN